MAETARRTTRRRDRANTTYKTPDLHGTSQRPARRLRSSVLAATSDVCDGVRSRRSAGLAASAGGAGEIGAARLRAVRAATSGAGDVEPRRCLRSAVRAASARRESTSAFLFDARSTVRSCAASATDARAALRKRWVATVDKLGPGYRTKRGSEMPGWVGWGEGSGGGADAGA